MQRLIGKMAEPGSALYDTILQEAAARDLEEAAGPKADWILAQVSPTFAVGTAETLMKKWTETDPLSASEWLNAVPREAFWRRAAIMVFVSGIEPRRLSGVRQPTNKNSAWRKSSNFLHRTV